jgi:hypothetical protein
MSTPDEQHREEQALDALIVLALRPDLAGDPPPDLGGPGPALTEEDRRALAALGPDLAALIAAGVWEPRPTRKRRKAPRRGRELTGSLHRAQEEGELTEEARAEMERKVRELDEEEGGARP